MDATKIFAPTTKQNRSRSGRRNRRRAKDLDIHKIMCVKADFEVTRSTFEAAQKHLLPRAEAVDAVLLRVVDDVRTVRDELMSLRRELGMASSAGPFLVRRAA